MRLLGRSAPIETMPAHRLHAWEGHPINMRMEHDMLMWRGFALSLLFGATVYGLLFLWWAW